MLATDVPESHEHTYVMHVTGFISSHEKAGHLQATLMCVDPSCTFTQDWAQAVFARDTVMYLKATLLYGMLDCMNQLVHVISCKQRQTLYVSAMMTVLQ